MQTSSEPISHEQAKAGSDDDKQIANYSVDHFMAYCMCTFSALTN